MMVMKDLFILHTRFTDEEIRQIDKQIHEEYKDSYKIVSVVTSQTAVVVTKLVQRVRLERELRALQLSRNVLIVVPCTVTSQDASYTVDLSRAYGIYSPRPDYRPIGSHVSSSLGKEPPHALVPHQESASSDVGQTEVNQLSQDIQDKMPVAATLPPLLRHESTVDPGSTYHRVPGRSTSLHSKYACQRRVPLKCLNETLASQFESMRLARILQGDSIGERAYSTAIASLRSLDIVVTDAADVQDLEGFGRKLMEMVAEWLKNGKCSEVENTWQQQELSTLLTFWNCHGVGAVTARDWYYNRGYRDLNDAIQDWDGLSRPIQIGLKHYEDFLRKIPRVEVEYIGTLVTEAARTVLQKLGITSEMSSEICGGYRRGKELSGDVDILLTHETVHGYHDMLEPLLAELEEKNIIRAVINSHHERDTTKAPNSGISIALVVISLPSPYDKTHRRLDIIICPPRSYITAITGWSGSTTLERDLRRYLNEHKGWTFDSTGISDMVTRSRISDESFVWKAGNDVLRLEENLFTFLGLDWIPPTDRNAG